MCGLSDFSKIPDKLSGEAEVRHRILQHGGRRYSVKLESGFWRVLEEIAEHEGIRLNHLVGRLAQVLTLDIGLTAALRLFCLTEAVGWLRDAEARAADLSLASGTTDVAALVEACPSPCVMLDQDRVIVRVNEAFTHWLGAGEDELVGKPLDRFFQIRGHFRLDDLWARFARGQTKAVPAKLAYVAPGRVIVAKAHLCATSVNGPDDFRCLIMLEHRPAR